MQSKNFANLSARAKSGNRERERESTHVYYLLVLYTIYFAIYLHDPAAAAAAAGGVFTCGAFTQINFSDEQ